MLAYVYDTSANHNPLGVPDRPFGGIAAVGPGGSIGGKVREALLAEPTSEVTAIRRASSRSTLQTNVNVVTVPDLTHLTILKRPSEARTLSSTAST